MTGVVEFGEVGKETGVATGMHRGVLMKRRLVLCF